MLVALTMPTFRPPRAKSDGALVAWIVYTRAFRHSWRVKYIFCNKHLAEPRRHIAIMRSSSAESSPASFYTANNTGGDESTTASSPINGRPCTYRATRQLPRELKEHCQIFLEEQLCMFLRADCFS